MIVDDHEVVREGLRALLRRRNELAVVAEADSVATAIAEAKRAQPDVVIMDVRLPDGSGVEACRDIRAERPETKVIMLTSYADDEAVFASIMAGATGYLLKQTRMQALVDAIERAMRGESLLDPAVTQRVLERVRSSREDKDDELSLLSEQERKILNLVAEGKTNKEIAAEIFLSDKTVKNYVSSILSKLNLRRRSEAAAFIARKRSQQPERE
jgi:DNA-binding NarL/FixJ family response regulator